MAGTPRHRLLQRLMSMASVQLPLQGLQRKCHSWMRFLRSKWTRSTSTSGAWGSIPRPPAPATVGSMFTYSTRRRSLCVAVTSPATEASSPTAALCSSPRTIDPVRQPPAPQHCAPPDQAPQSRPSEVCRAQQRWCWRRCAVPSMLTSLALMLTAGASHESKRAKAIASVDPSLSPRTARAMEIIGTVKPHSRPNMTLRDPEVPAPGAYSLDRHGAIGAQALSKTPNSAVASFGLSTRQSRWQVRFVPDADVAT